MKQDSEIKSSSKGIKDRLKKEKSIMQGIVYNAIVDFESETGCQVIEVNLNSKGDGRGNAKTSYVSFSIRL